jgi:hypothetical protein
MGDGLFALGAAGGLLAGLSTYYSLGMTMGNMVALLMEPGGGFY